MIKSTTIKSRHAIVAVMNYTLDPKDSMFNKYEFASFYFDDTLLYRIKKLFKNDFFQAENSFAEFGKSVTLIEGNYIYKMAEEDKSKHIKLDGLTFLEEEPSYENVVSKRVWGGGITCYQNFFTIDAAYISTGTNYPSILYKSGRFNYQRIGNLFSE